jgi:hypothetical protein
MADKRGQLGQQIVRPGDQPVARRQHGRSRGPAARRRLEQRPLRPATPSASASSLAVSLRAVRLTPRSRSLTDRGEWLAAFTSSF